MKRPDRKTRSGRLFPCFARSYRNLTIAPLAFCTVLCYHTVGQQLRKEVTDMRYTYIGVDIDDLIYGERDGTVSER